MSGKALILGATGKVGTHSIKALEQEGWEIKRYNRQTGDMVDSAQGCDIIVNGLNPPNYHNWAKIIPKITQQVIEAAKASGASVIIPGNVYHFGDQPGVWSEQTTPKPASKKGRIRLEMERAYRNSSVQTIILRGGNFIDPNQNDCVLSTLYLRDFKQGRFILPGSPDVRQAFCYLPDWATAMVQLAEMRTALTMFEDIPFPGHTLTANQIRAELERISGTQLKVLRFPWGLMTALSPFWELAREIREMRYLWSTDHALDDQRFSALLPSFRQTALEDVLCSYVHKPVRG